MTIAVGTKLGRYEIRSKIGEGGMGEVYLAEDTKLHRRVAIKFLPLDSVANDRANKRLMREAQAAAKLDHPNICAVHEVAEENGRSFIVMPYVEGETLDLKMKRGPLQLSETLTIATQVADALAEAHTQGIIHRDIKPSNIIITPRGQPKVMDFGLAKLSEPRPVGTSAGGLDAEASTQALLTTPGKILGTVPYMSPEQVHAQPLDARTDIFSFGVVLYEMLTGQQPFVAESPAGTISAILTKEPARLDQYLAACPAQLQRIVDKCLAKNRERRYQTMRDVATDLENLHHTGEHVHLTASGEAMEMSRAEDTAPSRAVVSRNTLMFAAPLALLLLAALAYALFSRRTSTPLPSDIKSLAVLPLKNIGGEGQDDYISDGITDELITKLTKLKNVRVVSPSVTMRYKNSPKDAAQIARELNVEAAIEGTMRKVGSRFRLSIHLVNAQDGFEIWSDNDFESDLKDLLDAERQIAEAVASRLKGQLTPQERSLVAHGSTTNAEAYELFLRGKEQARKAGWQLARDLFDRAVQLDANFADAYAWRGLVIYQLFAKGLGDRSMLDAALADANRALQIEPNLISARRTLINIYHSTGQYEEGLKQGKRALETNADDLDAIEGAALAYFRAGMMEKAIPLFQRAVAADPRDEEIRGYFARSYLHAGEYQKGLDVLSPVMESREGLWNAMHCYRGLKEFDKAIELGKLLTDKYPDSDVGWLDFGVVLKQAGKPEQARTVWAEGAKQIELKLAAFENVRIRVWLGLIYAELGGREKALAQINRALALEPNDAWTLFQVGNIHAILNNRREAVSYIKQSIARGWLGIHYIDYFLDRTGADLLGNLRDDAEFQQVRDELQKKVDQLSAQY